eukprot:4090974-Prymnesium_polylepis.1
MEGQGAQIDSEVRAYMMETTSSETYLDGEVKDKDDDDEAEKWVLGVRPPRRLSRRNSKLQEPKEDTLPPAVVLVSPDARQPMEAAAAARNALLNGADLEWEYDVASLDRESQGHALRLLFLRSKLRLSNTCFPRVHSL